MNNTLVLLLSFIPSAYFGIRFYMMHYPIYAYLTAACLAVGITLMLIAKHKLLLQYWFGLAFSSMFIDIIFSKIEFASFKDSLKHINFNLLLIASLLVIASTVVQAFRWKFILGKGNTHGFADLYPSVMIGHLFNHILPAKAGEIVRSYHFGSTYNYSKLSILSTLVVERIFDGLMALSFILFFFPFIKQGNKNLVLMGIGGFLIYGGAFITVVLLFKYYESIAALLRKLFTGKFIDYFLKYLKSFSEGLSILNTPRELIIVILLSVVMWVIIAMSILPVMLLFDFSLPFYSVFCILACICLGMTLPSAPGGIGIISFATVFALSIIFKAKGIEMNPALYSKIVLFSLLINITMVLPEVIVGLFFAFKTGPRHLNSILNTKPETI